LFLITLQGKIGTVTVEGVENVGEEDSIKIKTEEDYIQLVRTVKSEQEVSVLCGVFCGSVCVCVCARARARVHVCCIVHCIQLHTIFIRAYHIFLFSTCQSAECTCVIHCV